MINSQERPVNFLRWEEMKELLASEQDPVTAQLMGEAFMKVFNRLLKREGLPVGDFDMRFFMEILQEFFSEHETIKKIIDGTDDRQPWVAEDYGT